MSRTLTPAAALAAASVFAALIALPAGATTITDPVGDFIPAFGGTHSGDLDVVSASVTFDGTDFHFGATLDGAIGTLPTSLYVIGVNRGAATSSFAAPPINRPGVVFDTVVTMTGTGVTGGQDLITHTALVLPQGSAHISGDSFELDIPLSLLPSAGFSPLQYGFNLWPRDVSVAADATHTPIADFAPDDATFVASAVPEPMSVALLGSGLLGMCLVRRRRR
jgi:PEP-CTERM motif